MACFEVYPIFCIHLRFPFDCLKPHHLETYYVLRDVCCKSCSAFVFVRVFVHVFVFVCLCVCVFVCVRMFARVYVFVVCMCVDVCVCVFACVFLRLKTCSLVAYSVIVGRFLWKK